MKGMINLQDTFLNQARKENMLTTVFLINGYQIKGVVRSFDNFTILLEVEGKQQLVYKHAVSTIIPMRNINLRTSDNDDSGDDEESPEESL
ncbi:MAG: RNA chaperone Hfq [Firmicutes bacterium]|nr:RNA chaperone Hfq [Bacillota bacterium]